MMHSESGCKEIGGELDIYKLEYDKHIEFVDNNERYESVLHWGFMSNLPPNKAAKVYDEKTLSFPEDLHIHFEGVRSIDVGHVYRFIDKKFPERLGQ